MSNKTLREKLRNEYHRSLRERLEAIEVSSPTYATRREEWRTAAPCRQDPGRHWFPDMKHEGSDYVIACLERCARSCDVCPVADLCLEMALTERHQYGIFANTTPSQRNNMLREQGIYV